MTNQIDSDLLTTVLQLLTTECSSGFAEGLRLLVNEAMVQERSAVLQARPYERSEERLGHANGFKPKILASRVGPIALRIPQVRDGVDFYPSSTQVSSCAAKLDIELQSWRDRPLGSCSYMILDARYEKVRQGGQLLDCAVLVAIGIGHDGKRSILGVSVALSEAEVHWRTFLASLQARGLYGLTFIVSDAHCGLSAARAAVFPSVPWQRCQFHLQQNAQAYVPRLDMRARVATDIRSIFNSHDLASAQARLKTLVDAYSKSAPKLSAWMEQNIPQGLAVFSLPTAHQRRMRTSNAIERVNQELKRRTRVASLFPNEASLLRLITALLCEISEEWLTGKIYLNMKPADLPQN